MAKKKKKTTRAKTVDATGKHLVIVESPAKARTINRYLGDDYAVMASVGHVRDLPPRAPKGVKQPVPGVDLDHDFAPTYTVLKGKGKILTELRRAAKVAEDVWFATDLDREGEAIAWHLAEALSVDSAEAKRVVFNAITKKEIAHAFEHPHLINMDFVSAQQARRILDRIVGYQVSPLLWKRVAGGLSAGRVQSVAVRLIVEREREIMAHIPDESWSVSVRLAMTPATASSLVEPWAAMLSEVDDRGRGPTKKDMNAFLSEQGGFEADLIELGGESFKVGRASDAEVDLDAYRDELAAIAVAVGLHEPSVDMEEDPDGKGPAANRMAIRGEIADGVTYGVSNITAKKTTVRPPAPFITSSLQAAASTQLGFTASRTMRAAQKLYEGITIRGEGQVGLITYMRTDSTHLSSEAITSVRACIKDKFGAEYLPDKPNAYSSSDASAQEAHEAIRPTDPWRHPDKLPGTVDDDLRRLYRVIWSRFVACQMTPALWDRTEILLERRDENTGAVLRTSGRTLAFDGFYRVSGVPSSDTEQNLPELAEGTDTFPFDIAPRQVFSSPPSRYSEASLIKELEKQGIGRPSTYASIIDVIQKRNYAEKIERAFHATDLGTVVTDKLVEAFPILMGVEYTRSMEDRLDRIADGDLSWTEMLHDFYGRFSQRLERAYEEMTHAKAETQPAVYKCPECGSRTEYRFGKNGRFLSCTAYPDCKYAAPIDRDGNPTLPERVDVACPEDGSAMELRKGRFGPFLASLNYPDVKTVVNLDKNGGIKYPAQPPVVTDLECEKCESPLNLRRGKRGPWLGCSTFPKCRGRLGWKTLDDDVREKLEAELEACEHQNPKVVIKTLSGEIIPEGTPVNDLLTPGGVQELERYE
jgi:DNA topoisomerase-1